MYSIPRDIYTVYYLRLWKRHLFTVHICIKHVVMLFLFLSWKHFFISFISERLLYNTNRYIKNTPPIHYLLEFLQSLKIFLHTSMSITSAACGRRSYGVSRCCPALESPEFWWTYEAKRKKERSTTSHYVSENSSVRLFINARRRGIYNNLS